MKDFEILIDSFFAQISVDSEDARVIISENPLQPKGIRLYSFYVDDSDIEQALPWPCNYAGNDTCLKRYYTLHVSGQ